MSGFRAILPSSHFIERARERLPGVPLAAFLDGLDHCFLTKPSEHMEYLGRSKGSGLSDKVRKFAIPVPGREERLIIVTGDAHDNRTLLITVHWEKKPPPEFSQDQHTIEQRAA